MTHSMCLVSLGILTTSHTRKACGQVSLSKKEEVRQQTPVCDVGNDITPATVLQWLSHVCAKVAQLSLQTTHLLHDASW